MQQCWNSTSHLSLMAGPETVGLRFLLCDPRSTKSPYANSLEVKSRSNGGWYPTSAILPSRTSRSWRIAPIHPLTGLLATARLAVRNRSDPRGPPARVNTARPRVGRDAPGGSSWGTVGSTTRGDGVVATTGDVAVVSHEPPLIKGPVEGHPETGRNWTTARRWPEAEPTGSSRGCSRGGSRTTVIHL